MMAFSLFVPGNGINSGKLNLKLLLVYVILFLIVINEYDYFENTVAART